jgi:hypothetical protein
MTLSNLLIVFGSALIVIAIYSKLWKKKAMPYILLIGAVCQAVGFGVYRYFN